MALNVKIILLFTTANAHAGFDLQSLKSFFTINPLLLKIDALLIIILIVDIEVYEVHQNLCQKQ